MASGLQKKSVQHSHTHEGMEGTTAPSAALQLKQKLRGQPYAIQQKALQPVQGKSGNNIHSIAAHGASGSGGQLPHLSRIQQAFGGHDVRGVKAHTGSASREATDALGAEAYAMGENVVFGENPTLHTAAHEAAHV